MNLHTTCTEKPPRIETFISHFLWICSWGFCKCFQEQMIVFWGSEASELNEDISIIFIDSAFLI